MAVLPLVVLVLMLVAGPLVGSRVLFPDSKLNRLATAPWWDQAREIYSIRVFNWIYFIGGVAAIVVCSSLYFVLFENSAEGVEFSTSMVLVIVGSVVAVGASYVAARRQIRRIYTALGREKNLAHGGRWILVLIFYGAFFITLIGMALIPIEWSWKSAVWITVFCVVLILWTFGGAVWLLQVLGALRSPASDAAWPRLVADEAIRCGLNSPPKIYELRTDAPNAFALTRNYGVAFTSGILEFPEDELLSIARHEFGHLTESRTAQWVRSLAPLSLAPLLCVPPLSATMDFPLALIIPAGGVLILAHVLRRFQLRMEKRADAEAEATGDQDRDDGAVYASALSRLYEGNLVPPVMPGKPQTHPHLYDRIVSLGIDPGYPRPAPPDLWPAKLIAFAWLAATALSAVATLFLLMLFGVIE